MSTDDFADTVLKLLKWKESTFDIVDNADIELVNHHITLRKIRDL